MAQLTLNLIQGAVSFNFSPEAVQTLKGEIDELMVGLKAILTQSVSGDKPQRAMEYTHT
jgi:hypothetical protein